MATANIAFCGIGRVSDIVELAAVFQQVPMEVKNQITASFKAALAEAASGRPVPGSRDKRSFAPNGTLFILYDKSGNYMFVVGATNKQYPERLAFQFLAEAMTTADSPEVQDKMASPQTTTGQLSKPLRGSFKELMTKYNDPAGIDKVAAVQLKVDTTQVAMQENIEQVLQNQADLEKLAETTSELNIAAAEFQESTSKVKRQIQWEKWKTTILLAGLGILGLVVIILIIILAIR